MATFDKLAFIMGHKAVPDWCNMVKTNFAQCPGSCGTTYVPYDTGVMEQLVIDHDRQLAGAASDQLLLKRIACCLHPPCDEHAKKFLCLDVVASRDVSPEKFGTCPSIAYTCVLAGDKVWTDIPAHLLAAIADVYILGDLMPTPAFPESRFDTRMLVARRQMRHGPNSVEDSSVPVPTKAAEPALELPKDTPPNFASEEAAEDEARAGAEHATTKNKAPTDNDAPASENKAPSGDDAPASEDKAPSGDDAASEDSMTDVRRDMASPEAADVPSAETTKIVCKYKSEQFPLEFAHTIDLAGFKSIVSEKVDCNSFRLQHRGNNMTDPSLLQDGDVVSIYENHNKSGAKQKAWRAAKKAITVKRGTAPHAILSSIQNNASGLEHVSSQMSDACDLVNFADYHRPIENRGDMELPESQTSLGLGSCDALLSEPVVLFPKDDDEEDLADRSGCVQFYLSPLALLLPILIALTN